MVKSVTLLDELDCPNDLSVFIMKTAIIILSYFSNHLTFQTEFKVSHANITRIITLWLVYCIVHLDFHDYIKGSKIGHH